MDAISTEKLSKTMSNATTYAIITHKRPDGDAISSSLAMFWYLIDIGKDFNNIDVIIPEYSNDFSFIPGIEYVKKSPTKEKYDVIFVVDCAEMHLLEGCDVLKRTEQIIVFDHHEKTTVNFTYSIIDTFSPSCTCIIFNNFSCSNEHFFSCIATGLISDTSNLSLNVTAVVKDTLEKLEKLGVDIDSILSKLTSLNSRTLELVNLIIKRGYFINSVFCTYLLQTDLLDSEKSLNVLNQKALISELQKSIKYTSLILLIENDKGEFKGSLRTLDSNIDLSAICSNLISTGKLLKGGGHSYSSGCTAIGSCHDIIETIANEILK